MRVPHSMKLALPALAVSILAACGGSGGGGLSDVDANPVTVTVTGVSSAIAPGTTLVVSGAASSKPKLMKTMAWTLTPLTSGAPTMAATNADCATGTRGGHTTNGISQSIWSCDVAVTAPSVSFSSTYRLTFTGTDEAGNASSSFRDVIVTAGNAGGPVSTPPIATTTANVSVAAGDDVGLNCFASGGTPDSNGAYSYQWVVRSNPSGMALSLQAAENGGLSFKAPSVHSTASVTLQCRVTDANLQTSTSDTIVTVSPSGTANAIANAGIMQSVASNTSVQLDASASAADGNPVLYYKWTQVEGPVVALSDDAAVKPTFVSPVVAATTRLTFQVAVMQTSPANPATAAPSELATVSVYVLPQEPLTLVMSTAQVVATGTAVNLTVNATPAGGTLYYAWTQVSGPAVTIGGANTATASFISPAVVGTPVDSVFSVSVSRKPLAQSLPAEIATGDVVIRTTP